MRTYGDFIHAATAGRPPAHFGLISADRLRDRYDRLMNGIQSLGNLMRVAHSLGQISPTDDLNYIQFQLAWLDFYAKNRPWSVLWNSDSDEQALAFWEQDFLKWRTFYEDATGKEAPPHIEPKDLPKDKPSAPFGGLGGLGGLASPAGGLLGESLGTGLTIAGLAILLVWASAQTQKGR